MRPDGSGAFGMWLKAVSFIFLGDEYDAAATNSGLERVAAAKGNVGIEREIGLPAALAEEERVGDRAVDVELASLWFLCDLLAPTELELGTVAGLRRDEDVGFVPLSFGWSLCNDFVGREAPLVVAGAISAGIRDVLDVGWACSW